MNKLISLIMILLAAALTAGAGAALGESWTAESFLVISDTHLTEKAQDHAGMMEAVVQASLGKDAVLLLGDNTNNTHTEEHALVLQWAAEIEYQAGAEVFVIPGNHDYSVRTGTEEFRSLYAAYGWDRAFSRDETSASYAVMTEKGTCLLLLDTNRFDDRHAVLPDGGIGPETLDWLREVLQSLPDGTPVLACGHHPILPDGRNARTPGASALGRVLREYRAALYLCGHDHGFATLEQDALRQITVGQPQAYPGWAGVADRTEAGFHWHTEPIYDPRSPIYITLRESARDLGRRMAAGTLAGTPFGEDEGAIEWFAAAFMQFAGGEMTPESSAALLQDENSQKWREAETPTVVRDWMLNLLENCPENVQDITVPQSLKHPAPSGHSSP